MKKKKVLYVHDDEHIVPKMTTIKSNGETNLRLKIKNRSTMHKPPSVRPIK